MAYNREWDYGKGWEEKSEGYRGYTRGREEGDNYGEGKRRKYNNGGYQESWPTYDDNTGQQHSSGPYDNSDYDASDNYNAFGYEQSQANGYRDDRPYRDRSGPPQNRKKHVASEPSPHVIFLGLDLDFTEADLQNFLKGRGCVIETVTIIRDRNTGQSKGFGFAQFRSTEEAQSFVDPNFPLIWVPPPASHGATVATTFKNIEEYGGQHTTGKRIKIDYSQSQNGSGHPRRGPQFSNDGTRDIGNTQSAVLLLRGLDPLSGPAAIAQAMKGSSGPNVEGGKGMKRVIVIKDKATMASWGFAFVEFIDIQAAAAVLAATMSPQLHANGFRISDRPVAASFAHPYSFQPLAENVYPDESCIPSSVNLGGTDGLWVKYWDEASILASMDFKVDEPQAQQQTLTGKEKKDKEKRRVKAPVGGPSVVPEASALPLSDKPVTLSFNKVGASTKAAGSVISQTAQLFSSNEDDTEDHEKQESNAGSAAQAKSKQAQKVPPMIASKKIVNNISKWNQVQEELNSNAPQLSSTTTPSVVPSVSPTPIRAPVETLNAETEFEFSDTRAITCLLCSRQFKTLDQLKRHNKESDLHKKNYMDANLRDVAREKAKASKERGKDQSLVIQGEQSNSKLQYRDRASERRTLFNQPDVPMPEPAHAKPPVKRSAEGPPPAPSPPPPPVAPGKDESNIGNKLLKMMGWTEGTGLGTEREGRVDPIQTAIYASGAGLGSSKGKEVGKYQEGYTGYVQMAKDVARDRFDH